MRFKTLHTCFHIDSENSYFNWSCGIVFTAESDINEEKHLSAPMKDDVLQKFLSAVGTAIRLAEAKVIS